MANFALIDENNIVVGVTPIEIDNEKDGVDFLFNTLNIKKSYPEAVRAKMTDKAGIGFTWIENDIFRSHKLFESWILSEDKTNWISPIPYPNDGKIYYWNEEKTNWIEIPTKIIFSKNNT